MKTKTMPSVAPIFGRPGDDFLADKNREELARSGVLAVALVGPPGSGKTALIEATARQLRGKARVAVIVANPAAERDANRVCRYCDQVEPVNTPAPDASHVRDALDRIDLTKTDVLFIESVGGITGVPNFGHDQTVTVLAVSGGDDKAMEYSRLLARSAVLLLSKAELQRHVMFDRGAFRADVRRINPEAEIIEVSAFENQGLNRWLTWLDRRRQEKDPTYQPETSEAVPEWFFG